MISSVLKHTLVCQELIDLYEIKNADYGNSFGETFKEFGMTMTAIRLDDKLRRYKQLIKSEQKVKDESIRDTLLDLANYAIMTIMEIDGVNEDGRRPPTPID